mgnify:CR=1 FL=1|tara:strand:- start:1688 stop:1882 length:195 start_codon:yes stop_codon:yes gene_type:complete
MIKCPICKELISPSSLSYKISAGFLDGDGVFHEDVSLVVHKECQSNWVYNPFEEIEKDMKDGKL